MADIRVLIPFQLSKGERTRRKIIESTIVSVPKYGFEGTTVSTIAKLAKVNRGSIVQYFSTTKNLFDETVKEVFSHGRTHTQDYMASYIGTNDVLEKYIRATYAWFEAYPKYAQFMTFLFTRSSYDSTVHKVVDGLVKNARKRMAQYIEEGKAQGLYSKKADADHIANILYTYLMGSFLLTLSDQATVMQRLNEILKLKQDLLKK